MPRWPLYSATVIVAGLVGLSLTKTPALQHASGSLFFLAGSAIALLAIGIYRVARQRIEESLPPARQMRGLKVVTVGLLIALCGWLVATFVKLEYGVSVVVLGMAVGTTGMAYHVYLLFSRDDA